MAVAVGRTSGPRVDWQVALLSKGAVEVAAASFTAAELSGSFGCFVTGKAQVVYRTGSGKLAAELTAEVFAAAFEACSRYRCNGTPARAWLFGIANHKLADSARRRRIDDRARRRLGIERLELGDQELERVELADLERSGARVDALVADLPPAEREAVLARVVNERSYVELAESLGVSREILASASAGGSPGSRSGLGRRSGERAAGTDRAPVGGRHRQASCARRRVLVATGLVAGLLLLASVASAVTGVGPAGGLFDADEAIPPSAEPAPGGRRALLHAGGEGAAGWDLLFYRSELPRLNPDYPRPYCVALARSDARAIPRGGIKGPPDPSEVYGGSTECEHPLTFAARLLRERMQVGGNRGGAYVAGPQRASTVPFYGLVLADAERVTLTEAGKKPAEAELSRPFRIRVPPLTPTGIRDLNPRQRRLTADLPRAIELRAFLGVLEAPEIPVGQRIPVVTIKAEFEHDDSVSRSFGGQLVRPQPKPDQHALEPRPGGPTARLYARGPDGKRFRAIGYETRARAVCVGIARLPSTRRFPDRLGCGSGLSTVWPLARGGLRQELSTDRPERARSSHAHYGLTRGDGRSLVFEARDGRVIRARLSRVWTIARWDRRELRSYVDRRARRQAARLPRRIGCGSTWQWRRPAFGTVQPRLTLDDGRTLNGRWKIR
jgi:RNA polymerase sigma factor (sigma-70 family)